MKIRFKDSSLRFRLEEHEIMQLSEKQNVIGECIFSAATSLHFAIIPWHLNVADIRFIHHEITVQIPEEDARNLAQHSSMESLKYEIENGQDKPLVVLIEKDFPCLHMNTGEN